MQARNIRLRQATAQDAALVADLGTRAWWAHYPGIITEAQIRYMLARMYTPAALLEQWTALSQMCLIAEVAWQPLAFAAWSLQTDGRGTWAYLNKLYAVPEGLGLGLGKALLAEVCAEARRRGLSTLRLNVNKYNPTVAWYERQGFTVLRDEVLDIGNGYVMDDYVLELRLHIRS